MSNSEKERQQRRLVEWAEEQMKSEAAAKAAKLQAMKSLEEHRGYDAFLKRGKMGARIAALEKARLNTLEQRKVLDEKGRPLIQ